MVAHRERVAREKRRAFCDQIYWGRPLPGFGDPRARLLILGLAPAAHGGNRTGRMFTGDRSGDFLYAALHRAGLASQPVSVGRDDGLVLRGAYITASVHCAPPANKPLPEEILRCAGFLRREMDLLPGVRVILCLGGLAFRTALDLARERGCALPRPLPRFGHGVEVDLRAGAEAQEQAGAPERAGVGRSARTAPPWIILGSYHPSQQNTFTGRLTPTMIDTMLARARALTDSGAAIRRRVDATEGRKRPTDAAAGRGRRRVAHRPGGET